MNGYEDLGCLHDMFRAQVQRTPDAVAVVTHNGGQITFKELDELTDILSDKLRYLGVKPNSIVGIYMEKCLEYTISYIAILKAGGAYMPLDISYPPVLLNSILLDSDPAAICTKPEHAAQLNGRSNVIEMKKSWPEQLKEEMCELPPLSPLRPISLDTLAYVVYSSGTTGKPKGIMCRHRGAVFSYHWRHINYPYDESGEREACNVFFVWEMLRPLLKGIPMYIIPDTVIYDPKLLCEFIKKNKITRMLFTPSLIEAVIECKDIDVGSSLQSLRSVWFCGEVVTTDLCRRVKEALPRAQLVNLYSVSEAHDIACADLTHYATDTGKFCPVGKVLPGVSILILDNNLKPQPVGVPGEIFVAGPTLANGYLNRPELNAQRFLPCPEDCGIDVPCKIYRTGDWGYVLSDRSLEICGRCDSMVKIRGYSIELQAVESALLALPMVSNGCVIVVGEEGQEKFLVAYVVPHGEISRKMLRQALKRKLPFYMIPSRFIFMESIPMLPMSGKLDKKALPSVDVDDNEVDEDGMPTTETEKKLCEIWCDVLHTKKIDIHESFFDLGGHSLLATQLLNKVNTAFNSDVSVKELFHYSSVQLLASMLDGFKTPRGMSPSPSASNLRGTSPYGVAPHIDLIAEVEKHDQAFPKLDIQLRAFWRSVQLNSRRWNTGKVLLTGATGFLGAFLLKELLLNTTTTIFCLIRNLPDMDSRQRLRNTLQQYGIIGPEGKAEAMDRKVASRVITITGDVALLNLGLSEDDYMHLTYEIDFIIHAAAMVNLVYPYRALAGPNVLGTQNIIMFSTKAKIKPIHYISTDAVFPDGITQASENEDMTKYANQLMSGYAQTKWVAEQLMMKAKERGLPVAIYRCGNIGGTRDGGFWNPADFTLLFLHGVLKTRIAPSVDWKIEFTPVDFVSNVIVRMTNNIILSMGKVFHFVNAHSIDANLLWQWLKGQDYPLKVVNYPTFFRTVMKSELPALQEILNNMIGDDESWFSQLSTYSQSNLLSALGSLGLEYPAIDQDLLKLYLNQLTTRGVLPRPPLKLVTGPLTGKIAVVTGASSGIGQAVVELLASNGAKVGCLARRLDRLQKLTEKMEDAGCMTMPLVADVTKRSEVKDAVDKLSSLIGPVDILVNCAGVMYYTLMRNLHQEEWERTILTNCLGMTNSIGAVLDGMVKRNTGHIVNISSDAGKRGFAGLAVYSGSKFFVEGMSSAMRQELVEHNIKVTCIQPGDVKTELLTHTSDEEARKMYDGSESCRILDPQDVAQTVLFAVTQPEHCSINEILVEPRSAPI